ncbi:VCBS domain-containing protein [Sphingopyxis yananensis]|uniref:VCBS domain-containing protein n=1 Tax=Sphingopyxis yananensis TaxID=2886687 RepID=UPI001D12E174|nr:VCBS domain-containing protein [Sphingopyxis yananensis]MCC2602359.1 VCBS domain-containing protein [Sphingopyxis yananensis]
MDAGAEQEWTIDDTQGIYGSIEIDPDTGKWVYTLDNGLDATQALNTGESRTERFTVRVTDEHGAYSEQVIVITVNGSNDLATGLGDQNIPLDEDNVASGSIQDFIEDVDDTVNVIGFSIDADGDGVDEDYLPGESVTLFAGGKELGTVTIAVNGDYSFTPAPNYSGPVPPLSYTVQEGNGTQEITQKLTFVIAPVSDAPTLPDPSTVDTLEDNSVTLGLVTPVITDTGTGNGDVTERLGEITLTVGGAGATGVTFDMGGVILSPVDGKLTIILTDVPHVEGLPTADPDTGVYYMTPAQYEALKAVPAPESGKNFTVTADVTSYEVDADGNILDDVPGALSSQTITVDVQAVTDGVTLSKVVGTPANPAIDEDGTYNLTDKLTVALGDSDGNAGTDDDGSETYWFEISDLPVGSTINIDGVITTITSVGQVVTSEVSNSPTVPSIIFGPPPHFSGELPPFTVTIKTQDTDTDSPDHTPDILSSSVTFELDVRPIANDVDVGTITTPEDTAVNFLENVRITDTNGDGQEVINAISFTIPVDWAVKAPAASAGWTYTKTGDQATITFNDDPDAGTVLTQAQREVILDGFTIQPPAHSSLDETITLTITTTDKAMINGVEVSDPQTEDHDLVITVTPVAERTDTDSDGDTNDDVTMSSSHEYDVAGKEDQWFALGTNYNDAANPDDGFAGLGAAGVWTNSDSDEFTYAVLTPTLESDNAGDSVIGTTFRFSTDGGATWHTRVYDGTPVWIPAQYLDTLQVKLPADVSGTLTIGVQAGTVDFDDDFEKNLSDAQKQDFHLNPPVHYGDPAPGETLGGLSSSNSNAAVNVSGSEELTMIKFDPVADDVTMALNGRASGLEDTDIPLSIRTTTSDPSETINVTISDIPVGATITYTVKGPDGTPVVTTFTATDGNQSMTIIGFDNDAKVTITPPLHSNADFTLNVSAVSVDGSSVLADPVTRPIYVQVQGVADVTTVVLSNSGSVTEAALDTSGNKIALSDFVTTVTSPDKDGSETLTLRITGLDANFTLVGATLVTAGTGAERVWSIPVDPNYDPSNPDHVNPFDNIFVVLPPNFSGKVSMEVAGVSTENDGDSLTGSRLPGDEPLIVTKDVIPSIDSIITTEFVLTEDQISPVNLQIVHQNGDTDEMLTEVYIPVNYDATQYEIYLGTDTLADSELTIVQIDGVDYYVIPSAQLPDLGVKASENLDGDVRDLPIKYQITDPATLGPLDAGIEIKDATLEFTVKPVTDPVELDIADIDMDPAKGTITLPVVGEPDSRFTVNVTQSGTVTVQINATSNDDDGSEQVTRVLIQNVPEGVTINGASMIGNGEWLLVLPAQDPANPNSNIVIDGNGQSIDLEFVVGIGTSDGLSNIKITVQTQDRGTADPVQEDEIDFNLDVKLGDGGTFQLPTIDEWSFTPVADNEDTRFALDQVIDGKVTLNETGAKHLLAITLTDLPDGTKVEYGPDGQLVEVQRTWVADNSPEGGKFVWTIAVEVPVGGNGQSVLDQMLQDIRITPPANSNDNNADFTLDAQLKVVVVGGPSVSDKVVGDVPITPVTDQPSLSITTSNVDEGSSSITAVIAGGPSANDNGNAVIVDGKVYVSVTATGNPDGVLSRVEMVDDGEGGLVAMKVPLVLESVTGVDGVPDGDYYVIDTNNTALPVTLDFSAPDGSGLILGDVVFNAILQSKETGAANTETANASGTSEVKLANNGAEITVAPATGDEAVLADKANAIRLEGLSVTLNDSSELIKAIMLTGLPNGFLLYIGEDAGSATLANQASNAGGDGSTNTWILAEGNKNLPPFIAILPPAHWSGTIEDLMIIVASGESQLNDTAYDSSDPFTLTIASRPNGITIDPTNSFGVEGRPILLNLNAAMVDNAAALSPVQDSSTETTTLEIKGLGEHAAFDVDGVLYNNVTYNAVTDVYTITGLTQAQLDKLAVVQAANAITDQDSAKAGVQIDVTAWTVEGDTGAESDKVNAKLNLAVTPVLGTTGADHFIWGDHKIDGKAGIDTVSLRVGEDVSRADLVAKLKNIEEIDLSVKGANGISGGLTLADVVSITGKSTGTLTITGDADDFITLSTGSGWTTTGVAQDGYVAYTSGNATLLIDEDILATNITFV